MVETIDASSSVVECMVMANLLTNAPVTQLVEIDDKKHRLVVCGGVVLNREALLHLSLMWGSYEWMGTVGKMAESCETLRARGSLIYSGVIPIMDMCRDIDVLLAKCETVEDAINRVLTLWD